MDFKKIINQKFHKVTPILLLDKFKSYNNFTFPYYLCNCDCGNQFETSYYNLEYNKTKSCGECPKLNLINQKFTRLTPISYNHKTKVYDCLCDCGNVTTASTKTLTSNNKKSCGCLNTDSRKSRIQNLTKINTKYSPLLKQAHKVHRNVYKELDFDIFYKLSQENCSYCNSPPINKLKYFTYNGLDRIDSSKDHNQSNITTCCIICNKMKLNRPMQEFMNWLVTVCRQNKIYTYQNISNNYNKQQISLFKDRLKQRYENIINIDDFIYLSTQPCHYCSTINSNTLKSKFIQVKCNGLDRIDSNKSHMLDNLVPACKYCNWAKNNLSQEDFYQHIDKIKSNIMIF